MPTHRLLTLLGAELVDNNLNNLFPDVASGGAVTVAYVQVINATTGTITAQRAWLAVDPAGCTVNLAVADATPRAGSYTYTPVAPTFGAVPSDYASGLTLADLAAGQKLLLAVRRDPTGASVASPEVNALTIRCSAPA